ncbi:MAG TPA: trypsin-like peptidase domain-containing protein [Acidimicrobiales bacterium]|nr:trypsin-like peptidase domain-containing protein [Acidimicrobiales bacterium]
MTNKFTRARAGVAAFLTASLLGGVGIGWATAATGAGPTIVNTSSKTLSLSALQAAVDPAVVDVTSSLGYQQATAAGTGIVLTSSGEILTNNHVIEGATSIKVTDLGNDRTYTARVVGYDPSADVAVLQLQGASGLRTATLANSKSVTVGQSVVALGNAGGRGGTPSVASGTITALDQSITASNEGTGTSEHLEGLLETDADVQAGDSGGPLVDMAGQVIGMDTAGSSGTTGATDESSTPQGYAIPVDEAVAVADQIEQGRSSATVHVGATAMLGVEVTSESTGGFGGSAAGVAVAVAGVVPGSPASKAGLATGDVITRVAGRAVTSPTVLSAILASHRPGSKVSVTWTDTVGQQHTATVTLTSGPAA